MSGKKKRKTVPAPELTLGKKLLFACVSIGLFFLVAELLLAVAGVQPEAVDKDPYVGFDAYVPLFEPDPASGEMVTARAKLEFFNRQRFRRDNPAGTFRIFTLGGSTTYGRPYDHRVSFSHWMELLLNAASSDRAYEVINAGGISYASYRIVVLMRELVQYDPDLFVVYTGHNEFLEERTYRDIIDDGPVLRSLRRGASHLRTAALLERLVGVERERDTLSAEVQAKLDVWSGLDAFTRDDALWASVMEHFRFNVRQMIEIARDNGVDIVFAEPASNVKDFSPFKSEHGPRVGAERRARFERAHQKAREAASDERCAYWDEAVKLSPDFAETQFRLGRCRLSRGDTVTAGEHLVRAKEMDVAPLRALEDVGRTLREVTRDEGVPLVPLRTFLEEDSLHRFGHALLGNEYFLDHVHPRVEIHQRFAEWILDGLARAGIVRALELTRQKRESIYDEFLAGLDRSYYAKRDLNLGKVLGWAGKNAEAEEAFERARENMPDEPELLRNLAIVYQKQAKYDQAVETYLALERERPMDAEVYFNLGKCWQGVGAWVDAKRAFERALALDPDDAKSHYNLALTLRELGRPGEELAELEAASHADPDLPGIDALLGSVYAREERFDEAIAAFERALAREPDAGAAHYHLASVYAARGQRDPALEHFRRAKELGIDVPDVVFEELGAHAP